MSANQFANSLHDVFSTFGPIHLKRMFGGHGVFSQGKMFALVVSDQLYIKVDAGMKQALEERGYSPFTYVRQGKTIALSYMEAPEEIYDDPDDACDWARQAYAAALAGK
ncbi:MAG: TfoX/Sxy family protein [Pseudomonadota bacterium]|jgi:DNA transformation protein|uniref:DNA transformation protein n=1 Tax=Marisediminitalea aggregata TaxID=634436 RepID=A0A1M5EUM8_9ALTE|nr:TfoX/Sxy family protein [Marisediminitalea aggregata]MAP22146.1 transcriptional regulator [Alteromonadaceae bacterium]MCP3862925.1 TfoX/Sxy family protein [Aestuariibacter sp.]MEC7470584.1 TfoX/Sxy family protein [Pseudomonadota bacterium]HBY41374.1 transcriptional regulator [Alteromonas sp.]MAX43144.1 transcriptional regulator [Alteromonadaceae bacterium]|tara:strand:- start:32 stop:358 length:327 start_codon:yes stop_codon:yes gene_type:complete